MLESTLSAFTGFVADQKGIDDLKNEVFNDASEFSYFNKGMWSGMASSVANAEAWAEAHPDWSADYIAPYNPPAAFLARLAADVNVEANAIAEFFGETRSHAVCRRVICNRGISEQLLVSWARVCGARTVARRTESSAPVLNFVLNETQWAIFMRLGPDELRGIRGTDRSMIASLSLAFDYEFVSLTLASSTAPDNG